MTKPKSKPTPEPADGFVCKECGSPLMPLPHRAGVCHNGHGEVHCNLPKLVLSWLSDQHKRGRKSAAAAFIAKASRGFRECELDGLRGKFTLHRITDKDTLRRRSVPKIGDDLPDGYYVGVMGTKVRMLAPVEE